MNKWPWEGVLLWKPVLLSFRFPCHATDVHPIYLRELLFIVLTSHNCRSCHLNCETYYVVPYTQFCQRWHFTWLWAASQKKTIAPRMLLGFTRWCRTCKKQIARKKWSLICFKKLLKLDQSSKMYCNALLYFFSVFCV